MDKKLEQLIRNWEVELPRQNGLKAKVNRRIHEQALNSLKQDDGLDLKTWISTLWLKPITVTACIAMIIVATMLTTQLTTRPPMSANDRNLLVAYNNLIDPCGYFKSQINRSNPDAQLANAYLQMETYLPEALSKVYNAVHLSPEQAEAFKTIHNSYIERFEDFYSALINFENDYRAYERKRLESGEVDLFSVYQNQQQRNIIYRTAILEQQALMNEILTLLNEEQRERYGQLLFARY